jgi:hypothetical protein
MEDEGLAHEVIGRIPKVLGFKSGGVDALVARVRPFDDMLLNELHARPLLAMLGQSVLL